MRTVIRGLAALVLGFLVLPAFAADEKKADDKKPNEKKADDKKADDKKGDEKKDEKKGPEMVAAGQLSGKLVGIDETKKTVKIQIEVPKLNQGAIQGIQQAQNAMLQSQVQMAQTQAKLRAARDANAYRGALQELANQQRELANKQAEIAKHQANLYTKDHKDVEFFTADETTVRTLNPEPKFDDKGRIAKYTEEELKELKGPDPKAPGYNADFSELRPGVIVQLTLVKKKDVKVVKPDPLNKDKDKEKNKEADKEKEMEMRLEALRESSPVISQIMILARPPQQ